MRSSESEVEHASAWPGCKQGNFIAARTAELDLTGKADQARSPGYTPGVNPREPRGKPRSDKGRLQDLERGSVVVGSDDGTLIFWDVNLHDDFFLISRNIGI